MREFLEEHGLIILSVLFGGAGIVVKDCQQKKRIDKSVNRYLDKKLGYADDKKEVEEEE